MAQASPTTPPPPEIPGSDAAGQKLWKVALFRRELGTIVGWLVAAAGLLVIGFFSFFMAAKAYRSWAGMAGGIVVIACGGLVFLLSLTRGFFALARRRQEVNARGIARRLNSLRSVRGSYLKPVDPPSQAAPDGFCRPQILAYEAPATPVDRSAPVALFRRELGTIAGWLVAAAGLLVIGFFLFSMAAKAHRSWAAMAGGMFLIACGGLVFLLSLTRGFFALARRRQVVSARGIARRLNSLRRIR